MQKSLNVLLIIYLLFMNDPNNSTSLLMQTFYFILNSIY